MEGPLCPECGHVLPPDGVCLLGHPIETVVAIQRLRKPCEHIEKLFPDGHYEAHTIIGKERPGDVVSGVLGWCPGGEFLPEGALVIELCEHGLFDWHSLGLETLDYEEIVCPGGRLV